MHGCRFHTEPIRRERGQFNVKTDSQFLEPGFISVYAYGCEPSLRREDQTIEEDDAISREMEDVFLRGKLPKNHSNLFCSIPDEPTRSKLCTFIKENFRFLSLFSYTGWSFETILFNKKKIKKILGIRSLLTSYMQRELQPAIKDTLMKNMGYTVSYG